MTNAGPGYVAQSADTDIASDRLQFQIYASWSHEKKLQVMQSLWRDARALSLVGLRLRYPQASEEELNLREACLRLGDELARRVYGSRFSELAR